MSNPLPRPTMPERFYNLARPAFLFASVVAAGAIAWNTSLTRIERLEATKADRVEVQSEMDRMQHILERLDERTARMDRFVCRQLPSDLGCP